jgi:dihydrofolate reductase
MRQVVVLNRISLDGFYAGLNGEFDWFVNDPEVDQVAHEMIQSDTALLGANTYTLFEQSWVPFLNDPQAPKEARATAEELTNMRKVVFSTRITQANWQNTEIYCEDVPGVIRKLKQEAGTALLIMGSGAIVHQLASERLIDEYVLIVTPVILGLGKPLFKHAQPQRFQLAQSRHFTSGNVILHYIAED